jgi:hypothetical protein
VRVTVGCEFLKRECAGRNASEPMGSLVNRFEDADPVDTRGRPRWRMGYGSVRQVFRGSRGGMCRQINRQVRETRTGAEECRNRSV